MVAQAEMLQDPVARFSGFSPCLDGELVPDDAMAGVAASSVPLVIGTTRDEMQLFAQPGVGAEVRASDVRSAFERCFGERAAEAEPRYRHARPNAPDWQLASALETDRVLRVPVRALADARAAAGRPTWLYWFTWSSTAFGGDLGACHALDVPFVFRNLDQPGVSAFTGDGAGPGRDAVADTCSAALVSLSRRGDPGWSPYQTSTKACLCIDETSTLAHDVESKLLQLWT